MKSAKSLSSFRLGGIHPPENKLSATSPILDLPLPALVTIPVTQNLGAPAKVIVKKGDAVLVGQIIAAAGGFVSANTHSSVSGTVAKITDEVDSSGYKRPTITIKVEGDDWIEGVDLSDALVTDLGLTNQEMMERIVTAGIVGLGGAAFPSHVKLTPPKGKSCDVLIINGVECEPYLTADHRLMLEQGAELIVGIKILMQLLNSSRAVIGIENNKRDAIKQLEQLLESESGIEVTPLKVQYPQGGEKQLINATIGKEVPAGALPIEVGAVVHNVGTIVAIYHAVMKGRPLVERIITVTGKKITKPANFRVRIGTPVSHLIEAVGGLPMGSGKVINGGPMMGRALTTLDAPVVKGSSGILVMDGSESIRREAVACIRCAKCIDSCPMGLAPYLLKIWGERSELERAEDELVMDCIECGSCSFTCPANLPLLDYIRLAKQGVGRMLRERSKS